MGDFIQKIESSYHAPEKSGQKPSVQRYPLTGIDVLVVGAGIGGLTAALECYRKGHSVRIFERESTISATGMYLSIVFICVKTNALLGDMFSIGLSARRWFSHWPEMEKEFNEISPKVSLTTIKKHTGETAVIKAAMGRIEGDATKPSEEPMAIQMRAIFYRMLYNQVVKLNIEITYNKRAIEYTEDNKKAYVLTDDQQLASADVVVASDGIGSKSQYIVNKGNVETKRSGTAMYRAALPSAIAFADPVVVETFGLQEGQDAIVQVWMGLVKTALRLTYPNV
jgi:2-polyprenyl-6-methoxyphenol hydroxylase-like FAD-dependent oxidoreductase